LAPPPAAVVAQVPAVLVLPDLADLADLVVEAQVPDLADLVVLL
jgi:hypothetical protein